MIVRTEEGCGIVFCCGVAFLVKLLTNRPSRLYILGADDWVVGYDNNWFGALDGEYPDGNARHLFANKSPC